MLKLENRVKKGFIALTTAVMLSPLANTFIPLHFQNPSNLYAQSQENEQKKQSSFFEEYSKKEKKKADVKKYELQPVDINVYDKDGSFYRSYKNISTEKSKTLILKIPEGGRVELLTKSNYSECKIDMMIKEDAKGQEKPRRFTNPRTQGYAFEEYIDTSQLGLRAGTTGNLDVILEPIKHDVGIPLQLKSLTVDYEIFERLPPAKPKQASPGQPQRGLQPDMEEENRQFVPRQKPKGKKNEKREGKKEGKQEFSLSRVILGIGTENISQVDKDFSSIEADAYISPNTHALLHGNVILNHMSRPLDECARENVNITNLRAGGLYNLGKIFTIGAEVSHSSVNRIINFYDAFLMPQSAGSNSNTFILGKAGLGNGFGKNAIAVLAIVGIQSQQKILYDECGDVFGERTDRNRVLGVEGLIETGRDGKSKVTFTMAGSWLKFKPLGNQDPESRYTMNNGEAWNIKALAAVKVFDNFKVGAMAGYGESKFTYGLHHNITQDRTSIKLIGVYNF